jgi:hypothetical protein
MIRVQGVPRYRHDELVKMPVLAEGIADDLRWQSDTVRLWLARGGLADGEPFRRTVSVELYDARTGRWSTAYQYDAEAPMTTLGLNEEPR